MQELDTYANGATHGNGFLYGVLVGGVVGATVALLFAPKAGSELRGQIASATEGIRRRAGEAYGEASNTLEHLAERGRQAVRRGREVVDKTAASYTGEQTHSSSL